MRFPVGRCRADAAASDVRGFSLLEALVASALAGFVAMGVVSAMGLAITTSTSAQEITELTARSVDRQEFLNSLPFSDARLIAGGSLTSSVSGYSIDPVTGVAGVGYLRWQITDVSFALKRIQVTSGSRGASGVAREITLETYRILTQ